MCSFNCKTELVRAVPNKLVIGIVLHPRWESDRQRKILKLLAGFVPKILVAMVARVMFQSRLEGGAGLNVGMVVTNCRPSSTNRPEHEPGSHQTSCSKAFRPVWPWTASLPLRNEPAQIFYDVNANPFNWSYLRPNPPGCPSLAFHMHLYAFLGPTGVDCFSLCPSYG